MFKRLFMKKSRNRLMTLGELCDVPGVDDQTIEAFFAATHDKSRRLPMLIAAHVANKYQDELTRGGRLDALQMSEIRGALRALRLFATYYHNGIEEWTGKKGRGDAKA